MTNQFVTVKRNVKRNVKNIRVYKNTKGMYIMRGGKRVYVQEGTGQGNKDETGNSWGLFSTKNIKKRIKDEAKRIKDIAKHKKGSYRHTTNGDLVPQHLLEPLLQNPRNIKQQKEDSERVLRYNEEERLERLEKKNQSYHQTLLLFH